MKSAITVRQPSDIKPGNGIDELVSEWRSHLELSVLTGEISENTRKAYERGWDKFWTWLQEQPINQVDGDVIRHWIAELREEYSSSTINTWYAGPRSFFSWAVGNRRLAIDPTQGVRGAKRRGTTKRHRRSILENGEVRRVLDIPDRTTPSGKRDYAMLALKAYTACRDVEIHRSDYSDLRTEGGKLVWYVQGKGRTEKDEMLIIQHPEALDALQGWLNERGKRKGPLFTSLSVRNEGERLSLRSIRRIVKDAYKQAGVVGPDKTSHSMRHTAITNAIRHGASDRKVQSMARHKSRDTTDIYYHEVDRIEDPAEGYIEYDQVD